MEFLKNNYGLLCLPDRPTQPAATKYLPIFFCKQTHSLKKIWISGLIFSANITIIIPGLICYWGVPDFGSGNTLAVLCHWSIATAFEIQFICPIKAAKSTKQTNLSAHSGTDSIDSADLTKKAAKHNARQPIAYQSSLYSINILLQ
jgi:hypothetical protein